jgi:hypothetical protein
MNCKYKNNMGNSIYDAPLAKKQIKKYYTIFSLVLDIDK